MIKRNSRLKSWAKRMKHTTYALYLASRRRDVPWYAKTVAIAVVAYALSPIDLIPDFIPIIGMLDDLILIPLGIAAAIRLIPEPVMDECTKAAAEILESRERGKRPAAAIVASVAIVLLWIGVAVLLIARILR